MSERTCTPCNASVPGCFHDERPDPDHVPVPANVKPSSDPRKVRVLFDDAYGGWMGFEVPDPVQPALYSSLETLPRSLRSHVEVAGKLCAQPACFNKRWRRSATCRKHTDGGRARQSETAPSAAGQRGRFAQDDGGVSSPVPADSGTPAASERHIGGIA